MATSSARFLLPLVTASFGIILGLLTQKKLGHSISQEIPAHQTSESSRPRSLRQTSSPSPTGIFLKDSLTLTALECQEQLRVLITENKPGHDIEREALYRRWLTLTPASEILAISDSPFQNITRDKAFFHAWVALDETAAMEIEGPGAFRKYQATFAIENEYPNFIDYLQQGHNPAIFSALTTLAIRNPDLAKSIANIPSSGGSHPPPFIQAVAKGLATRDPESALTWVTSLPTPSAPAIFAILSEWAKTDPAAALSAKSAFPDLDEIIRQDQSFGNLPDFIKFPNSAPAHLKLALSKDPFLNVVSLHQHLQQADIDWTKRQSINPSINSSGWYSPTLESDARDAEKLPPGKARDLIIEAIANQWAETDLKAASQFAEKNGVQSIYLKMRHDEPTEEDRKIIHAAPEKALATLVDGDPGNDSRYLLQLTTEWSLANPEVASDLLIQQDLPNETSDMGNKQIFSNTLGYGWARQDSIGAVQWVDSLADPADQSLAWSSMQDRVSEYAPDLAFNLSAAWLDSSERLATLEKNLQNIAKSISYPTAFHVLENAHLPPAEATALSNSLQSEMNNSKK